MLAQNPMVACTHGERYKAAVPDTLDLSDRMALAVNALTNVWFPDEKWALAFNVDFSRSPTLLRMGHRTDAYLNIPAKFLEALALCRLGSGSVQGLDVDHEVLKAQLDLVGEDGLSYCPSDTLTKRDDRGDFAEIWGEGRLLLALSTIGQVDDDPRWLDVAKQKVDRLLQLSREKDGFRFFWKGRFRPGQTVPADAHEPTGDMEDGSLGDRDPNLSMIYSIGALGHGAGLLHRVTGYEPALELAGGLAKWALARMFKNDDGRYWFYHFHHGLYALMTVCQYGMITNDSDILERVDACYRWARDMGDPLVGFFSEVMPGHPLYLSRKGNTTEICEVADMLVVALWLTRAGVGDYWDDIDRWLRNIYAEGQMLDADFVDRIPPELIVSDPKDPDYFSTDGVAERSVGSFYGWMHANDGFQTAETDDGTTLLNRSIMHCCTANGARSLYHVWDAMLEKSDDEVTIHLLLNRASEWVDVESYVPAAGKVVLRIKDARRVAVRMPEWCDPASVAAHVGDTARRTLIDGRYVRVGWLDRGDVVTLTFPIRERVVHRAIGEIPFKLTMRGANVVEIDPKGVCCPLFENPATGAVVERERFVPAVRGVMW